MKNDQIRACFCGKTHRVNDGKPILHSCFVLPSEALICEQKGDKEKAKTIMAQWKNRRPHNGLKG
jgi:hypothetical protein